MKILIVEDEKALAESIADFLSKEGYICEKALTYFKAQEKINLYNYDCIIVDITLPDGNGLKIIEELKKINIDSGIIIISARNALDDFIYTHMKNLRKKMLTLKCKDYIQTVYGMGYKFDSNL